MSNVSYILLNILLLPIHPTQDHFHPSQNGKGMLVFNKTIGV